MASSLASITTTAYEQEEQYTVLDITWSKYYEVAEKLAKIIHDSYGEFDQIICIARGGMFIGDMFSRLFKRPLGVIFTKSYSGMEQGALKISENIAMVADKIGNKILLLDDLTDTGVTLLQVKQKLLSMNPEAEVKTGVLWLKSNSKFKPDFYAESVDESVWIKQPFEKYDEMKPEDL